MWNGDRGSAFVPALDQYAGNVIAAFGKTSVLEFSVWLSLPPTVLRPALSSLARDFEVFRIFPSLAIEFISTRSEVF
jgi:hypothetical protein